MAGFLERRWYAPGPPSALLLPLSRLYAGEVKRRGERGRRFAEAHPLSLPVIVVGNLTVGGTGKTPLVIWLVEKLRLWGWRPGVISRGYGGKAPDYPLRVTADTDPAWCGDEPALMAQRLGAPLAVAPQRIEAAQLLIDSGAVDVLVADDGLQHYRLPRDLELCVVDGRRGLGNGELLPAGPLREPPSRLDRVAHVIVNGAGWSPPGRDALRMNLIASEAVSLDGTLRKPLSEFAGQAVNAIAGIGHPERFFATLGQHGVAIIARPFPDHHAFKPSDLDFANAAPLLMTEKDAVKCRHFGLHDAWYVPVSAELSQQDAWLVRKSVDSLRKTR